MRTFCITSGKGGVGKTTLSINLGIAMVRAGRRVLLLDADLGLANLNVLLGLVPKFTIQDVVRGEKTLAQIVMPTSYGLDLVAGATGIADLANLGERESQHVLQELEGLNGYDILIIDTGAGISDNVIRFVLAADDAIVVTTPHPTAMTDAYGIIKTILTREPKTLKLLVNCVNSPSDAQHVCTRLTVVTAKFLNGKIEYMGYVPRDALIEKSIMAQKPHLILNPGAASAQRIREVAMRLLGEGEPDSKKTVGRFIQRLMGR